MLNNLHSSEVKESWLQETIASIEVSPWVLHTFVFPIASLAKNSSSALQLFAKFILYHLVYEKNGR